MPSMRCCMQNLLAAVTVLTLSTAQASVIHVDADN